MPRRCLPGLLPACCAHAEIANFAIDSYRLPNGETAPGRLERMIWLESNRFSQFLSKLSQEKLDRQRAVVINEKRQQTDGEVRTFPGHIQTVTLKQVNAAARKYARPERTFFVLVGDREQIELQLRDVRLGTGHGPKVDGETPPPVVSWSQGRESSALCPIHPAPRTSSSLEARPPVKP